MNGADLAMEKILARNLKAYEAARPDLLRALKLGAHKLAVAVDNGSQYRLGYATAAIALGAVAGALAIPGEVGKEVYRAIAMPGIGLGLLGGYAIGFGDLLSVKRQASDWADDMRKLHRLMLKAEAQGEVLGGDANERAVERSRLSRMGWAERRLSPRSSAMFAVVDQEKKIQRTQYEGVDPVALRDPVGQIMRVMERKLEGGRAMRAEVPQAKAAQLGM